MGESGSTNRGQGMHWDYTDMGQPDYDGASMRLGHQSPLSFQYGSQSLVSNHTASSKTGTRHSGDRSLNKTGVFTSASTNVSYQTSGDAGVASDIDGGDTLNHMGSKDKVASVDTVGKRAGLADVAGSPDEAAQGSVPGMNTGGITLPMQKPGVNDGNESNRRKQLRGRRKWEAKTGNLPYWEIKAKTALQVLYQHEHWPMLSPEARYESELGVKGALLDEASGDKKAQWMIQNMWSECVCCAVLACEAEMNQTSPRTGRTKNGKDSRDPESGDAKQSLDSGRSQTSTKLKAKWTLPCPKEPLRTERVPSGRPDSRESSSHDELSGGAVGGISYICNNSRLNNDYLVWSHCYVVKSIRSMLNGVTWIER